MGKGFKEVYNLKNGMMAWEALEALEVSCPPDMGMSLFKGNETPTEIISLAYGMEEGVKEFYSTMADLRKDSVVVRVLKKLALDEENHKLKLFKMFRKLNPLVVTQETFETTLVVRAMEGGITTEEFIAQNESAMKTVQGVLKVAMMLEAQALDLYMRYSEKCVSHKAREIFFELAEEEKDHLSNLGSLMENRIEER